MQKNFSEGASGSFFYFTVDLKYMVKTLTLEEHSFLRDKIKNYTEFMRQNPRSLVCHYYGLYSIEMYGHIEYVVVMNNFLQTPTENGKKIYTIDEIFDLKGSSLNRHAKQEKGKKASKKVPTLKDNDLQKNFRIGEIATEVVEQLFRDANFLRDQGIMDYSLLVGIHNCSEKRDPDHHCNAIAPLTMPSPKSFTTITSTPPMNHHQPLSSSPSVSLVLPASSHKNNSLSQQQQHPRPTTASTHSNEDEKDEKNEKNDMKIVIDDDPKAKKDFSGIPASAIVGPGIYHVGIIDCLQQWNWAKRLEQATKIVLACHCSDYREMSAVEPTFYAERFRKMVSRLFVQ